MNDRKHHAFGKRSAVRHLVLFLSLTIVSFLMPSVRAVETASGGSPHARILAHARKGEYRITKQLIGESLPPGVTAEILDFTYIRVLAQAGQVLEAVRVFEGLPPESDIPLETVRAAALCYCRRERYARAKVAYEACFRRNGLEPAAGTDELYARLLSGEYAAAGRCARELVSAGLVYPGESPGHEEPAAYAVGAASGPPAAVSTGSVQGNDGQTGPGRAQELEREGEFLAAYRAHERTLRGDPDDADALNGKYRMLLKLGATSLAGELLDTTGDEVDPSIRYEVLGNEAMMRIRWGERAAALAALRRNLEYAGTLAGDGGGEELRAFADRTRCDLIVALWNKRDMPAAVRDYESLVSSGGAGVPAWVTVNAADAYFTLGRPDRCLELYGRAAFDPKDEHYGRSRILLYHTLAELGRFEDSADVLETFDGGLEPEVFERGLYRENWTKEEVARDRGWLLLYQDRLPEAQCYFEQLCSSAPYNSHVRTGLAHTYLWRGWPRKALEEFEIGRTINPGAFTNEVGYCYTLESLARGAEARRQAGVLLKKHPRSKEVQELGGFLRSRDRTRYSLRGGAVREYPGAEETEVTARLEQPVSPRHAVFAEAVFKDTSEGDLFDSLQRGKLGIDARLNGSWTLGGSVSAGAGGDDPGFDARAAYSPSDHVTLNGFYDSFSLSVPVRERVRGLTAKEWSAGAEYRANESFTAALTGYHTRLSDGNDQRSAELRLDGAVTARTRWRTRLGIEGSAAANSLTDVDYYSPSSLYSVYLVPFTEHLWFSRLGKSLLDRLSAGLGMQWQEGYPAQDVWFVRYEQDYRVFAALGFTAGVSYALQNYDGEDTGVWKVYLAVEPSSGGSMK